jgi:hypothetical protein
MSCACRLHGALGLSRKCAFKVTTGKDAPLAPQAGRLRYISDDRSGALADPR